MSAEIHQFPDIGIGNVELQVGAQARLMRIAAKKSTSQIAEGLNITVAEYEMMENGHIRIPASTLYYLSKIYDCKVQDFF